MDLWERGLHAGLVGDAEAEGVAREGRAASGEEEENNAIARSHHDIVLLGKLHQAVLRTTKREGGGCLLPDDQTGRPVAEVLQVKHLDMRSPSMKNPTWAAFEEYDDVPETVPIDFTENDIT